jgi:hypothetical protein
MEGLGLLKRPKRLLLLDLVMINFFMALVMAT